MFFLLFSLIIFLTLLVLTSFVFLFFHLITIFTGAPYLGSAHGRIGEIIKIARIKPGEKAVDIGCGDGRIVIALAKAGADAYGFEINPFLVLLAKWKIFRSGLSKRAHVYWKNFWNADFSDYDIITVYGISYIMKQLSIKLRKEINSNARVISSSYKIANWKPIKYKNYVYLYKK